VPGKARETQEISVYKDLPLIAIDTWEKYGIVNAEEYRVISFTAKEIKVAVVLDDDEIDEDTEVTIPVKEFPHLLQPAYCISVHRSQCGTFRRPYTIYQTKKMREMDKNTGGDLGKRLLYVALSRASDPKFINISDQYD
jgi:ATP-dependent exoDNAse (exonuclease V) alpha subunit